MNEYEKIVGKHSLLFTFGTKTFHTVQRFSFAPTGVIVIIMLIVQSCAINNQQDKNNYTEIVLNKKMKVMLVDTSLFRCYNFIILKYKKIEYKVLSEKNKQDNINTLKVGGEYTFNLKFVDAMESEFEDGLFLRRNDFEMKLNGKVVRKSDEPLYSSPNLIGLLYQFSNIDSIALQHYLSSHVILNCQGK